MIIGFTADLHLHFKHNPAYSEFALDSLVGFSESVDGLVLCGDIVDYDMYFADFQRVLSEIRNSFTGKLGFIPGNHCIGSGLFDNSIRQNVVQERIDEYTLAGLEFGATHLEAQNVVVGDVTIGGTYGHYGGTTVYDHKYADPRIAYGLVKEMEKRMEGVTRSIIATHTLPHIDLSGRNNDTPNAKAFRPYAGSNRIAQALRKINPELHLCGHTHAPAHMLIGETQCYNIGSGPQKVRFLTYDTQTKEVVRVIPGSFSEKIIF